MPANTDYVAALPSSGGAADKSALRAALVTRNAYCLTSSEDSRDLVVIDPSGGGTVPNLIQNGKLYAHDPLDTTTAHDGVICLVSYDSQRYKLDSLTVPYAVLDKDLTAPPTSPAPSYGDTYLIYGSPTGAWAGHAGSLAIYTARGWEFATAPIGFLIYAEDEASYYHRDSGGNWVLGTGTRTLGNDSVVRSNVVGKPFRHFVINQTTTTPPPASPAPSIGDTYVVGPSASGAWAGKDGKLAICEDGSTFTIYTPRTGELIYDIALNLDYKFNGTGWAASAGAVIGRGAPSGGAFTQGTTSTTRSGSSGYVYSNTTAPVSTIDNRSDDNSITYTAANSNSHLRFTYRAYITAENVGLFAAGLFRDSGTTAIAWDPVDLRGNVDGIVTFIFDVTVPDASSHTYKMRFFTNAADSITVLAHRFFDVMETGS